MGNAVTENGRTAQDRNLFSADSEGDHIRGGYAIIEERQVSGSTPYLSLSELLQLDRVSNDG